MAESMTPGSLANEVLSDAVISALDRLGVAMLVKDLASGRYDWANEAASRLLALEGSTVVSAQDADLFDAGQAVALRAADKQAFFEQSRAGRHCLKSPDAEKPSGQWNSLDLYCVGDTAVHVVNGQVTMVLYKSRRPATGGFEPLTKGKIQLQSEGAEVFYRTLRIRSIDRLPAGLIKNN